MTYMYSGVEGHATVMEEGEVYLIVIACKFTCKPVYFSRRSDSKLVERC